MGIKYLTPTGNTSPQRRQLRYEPTEPEISQTQVLAAAIPAGVSATKFYNNLQNKKLTDSRLLQNASLRFDSGKVTNTGLPIMDDIFVPDTDQGFVKGFTNKWSKRLKVNPDFISDSRLGLPDKPTYQSIDDFGSTAEWTEANKEYTNWITNRQEKLNEKYSELEGILKDRNISEKNINNILKQSGKTPTAPGTKSIPIEIDGEIFDEDIIMDNIDMPDLGSFSEQEYADFKLQQARDKFNFSPDDIVDASKIKKDTVSLEMPERMEQQTIDSLNSLGAENRARKEILELGQGDSILGSKLYREKYGITDVNPFMQRSLDRANLPSFNRGEISTNLKERIRRGSPLQGTKYGSPSGVGSFDERMSAYKEFQDTKRWQESVSGGGTSFDRFNLKNPFDREEMIEDLYGGRQAVSGTNIFQKGNIKAPNLKNMRFDHVSGKMVPIKSKLPANIYMEPGTDLTSMAIPTKDKGVLFKDRFQDSKIGKGLDAIKNIGKGGLKDFVKGSDAAKIAKGIGNIGKGGLKSLFAAGTPATATTAATAAGPLAAMGPLGWTMLAGSLLGGKLFDKKTFLGKIFSDPRLKENIKKVGISPSGVNVYEFKYKGIEGTYRGVLANEVPWASSEDNMGHKMVDYSKVDVDFKKVS
tara:strand:- start:19332 stop:21257 length:1926 start_codon:yes stop_codon:yes gene_type:complete